MFAKSALNPITSIFIAVGSAFGFGLVLFLTPVKKAVLKPGLLHKPASPVQPIRKSKPSSPPIKKKLQRNQPDSYIQFYPYKKLPEYEGKEEELYLSRAFPLNFKKPLSGMSILSDSSITFQNDLFYLIRRDNYTLQALATKPILLRKRTDPILIHQQNSLLRANQLRSFEFSYDVSAGINAVVRSSSLDSRENAGKLQTVNFAMAGLAISPAKIFSTRIFTGDRYRNTSTYANDFYQMNPFHMNKSKNRANGNMFEWQTSFQPARNFGLETSYFNKSTDEDLEQQQRQEGARFSLFFGMDRFLVNLKYNYLADDLMRSIQASKEDVSSSDFAALGFVVYFDEAKQYSLYLGNNFHNIATNANLPGNTSIVPSSNSYTAMFRGKNPAILNSTFFFNFRNQLYRDMMYSNVGVFSLPILIQNYQEYSTSMGLELMF